MGPMDELDVRILRELTQASTVLPARPGLRASYRNIARGLAVSPGTVRNRVNRMYSSGVLTGSSVYANPNLLGLDAGAYALEVSPQRPKREVVDRLRNLEGVFFIQNFRGSFVGIAFVYEGEAARAAKLAAINRIAGAETGAFSRVVYPPCGTTLSRSEWRLVSRLVRRGFRTYAVLARELGVSVRTLKRRISKLVTTRAILSTPTMDYRALTGCVPADLMVVFGSPDTRPEAEREVFRLVGGWMIYAGVWADFGLYSLLLPRVSTMTEIADRVPHIRGVSTSRIELVDEHIDRVDALQEYVDRQWTVVPSTRRSLPTAAT
jgi:DNA-binding Lrp family transcriptional regulator